MRTSRWAALAVTATLGAAPVSPCAKMPDMAVRQAAMQAEAGGRSRGDAQPEMGKDPRAQERFPQPVRVGDLSRRLLIEPEESQHVLGRIRQVVRARGGTDDLIVQIGGLAWLGIGGRLVAVPADDVGLLGEYVALLDIDPADLARRPSYAQGTLPALSANRTIKVGIVKPFH